MPRQCPLHRNGNGKGGAEAQFFSGLCHVRYQMAGRGAPAGSICLYLQRRARLFKDQSREIAQIDGVGMADIEDAAIGSGSENAQQQERRIASIQEAALRVPIALHFQYLLIERGMQKIVDRPRCVQRMERSNKGERPRDRHRRARLAAGAGAQRLSIPLGLGIGR